MDRFIHEQNLAHYSKLLSEITDTTKRQTVLKLLAAELANIAGTESNEVDATKIACVAFERTTGIREDHGHNR